MQSKSNYKPKSVADYFMEFKAKLAEKDKATEIGRLIFRGQANREWGINSSAGRRLRTYQRYTQNEFIRYHTNLIANARQFGYDKTESGEILNDLEVLANIQHMGGATCLTDFSKNFLVALWMACAPKEFQFHDDNLDLKLKDELVDGIVYWLDLSSRKNFENISYYNSFKNGDTIHRILTKNRSWFSLEKQFKPRFWLWEPTKINERIISQDSVFLFSLLKFDPQDFNIVHIHINAKDKSNILIELNDFFGINASTIYKDLSGYSNLFNNVNESIHPKILNSKGCLINAKECIKKEKYNIAISHLDFAIKCFHTRRIPELTRLENNSKQPVFSPKDKAERKKYYAKLCLRTNKDSICEKELGVLLYWRGEAKYSNGEYQSAVIDYHEAAKHISKAFNSNQIQYDTQVELYRILCGCYRNIANYYYTVKDYKSALIPNAQLCKIFRQAQSTLPKGNQSNIESIPISNGIDAVISILELSIILNRPKLFHKFWKYLYNTNSTTNGDIIKKTLEYLMINIENRSAFTNKKLNLAIERLNGYFYQLKQTTSDKSNIVGHFYWDYTDLLVWISNIVDGKMNDALPHHGYIKENAKNLIQLIQKANVLQEDLVKFSFQIHDAIDTVNKDEIDFFNEKPELGALLKNIKDSSIAYSNLKHQ
jgi:tetratricopeptide (TPR) repeat protein